MTSDLADSLGVSLITNSRNDLASTDTGNKQNYDLR